MAGIGRATPDKRTTCRHTTEPPVLIVGAGVAGLACGLDLVAAGVPVRILEGADAVGGRMRN